MHLHMAFDLAKRDAVRIYCDRLREWLGRQLFSADAHDGDLAYRRGWSDAIKHVQSYLSR